MDFPAGIDRRGDGLRIRIYRKGKTVHTETLAGNCGPRHIQAAVKRRDELKAQYTLGIPSDDGTLWILRDAAQDFMNVMDAKESSIQSYRDILKRYWLPTLGNLPVSAITTLLIKQTIAKFRKQDDPTAHLSNKTKSNILIVLRAVLDHVEVNPNPCTGIKFKKRQKDEVERYLPEERDKLLAALPLVNTDFPGQVTAFFALMFLGLRTGECLALRWSDWDGENLRVERQIGRKGKIVNSTKTSMRRKVFVPEWVRPYFLNLETRFQGDFIFCNNLGSHHWDADVFRRAWKAAHKRTRIHYRRPYDCRHTRAAELLSAGFPPAACAKQMGHSVEMFFNVYSEWIEEYAGAVDFNTPRSPSKHRPSPPKSL